MGYLDSAGLSHFWGKVKTALAGKQNTITAGDGVSKTGDTLSVTTPVRGIVTQAEFDALPEEQRNKGLYVIPGGGTGEGGGESAGEVYSAEETRIGTWIDGKPLYRAVLYKEFPPAASGNNINQILFIPGNPTIETVVSIRGTLKSSAVYSIPFYTGDSTNVFVSLIPEVFYVTLSGKLYSQVNFKAVVIVEYTKTTDEGGET